MQTILLDPQNLGTAQTIEHEARSVIDWVKQSPPAPGAARVRIAGAPDREPRARREREGIAVDTTTWDEIHAAGARVGVSLETIDRLARG